MSTVQDPPTTRTTIVLKCGYGNIADRHREFIAKTGVTIVPGMLIQRDTGGQSPDSIVKPHATALIQSEKLFAKEKGWIADIPFASSFGDAGIDDAYAAGERVFAHQGEQGDEIYALLAPSATAVALTDYLTPHSDGTLKKSTATTDFRIAVPLKAVDNSANASTRARIPVALL